MLYSLIARKPGVSVHNREKREELVLRRIRNRRLWLLAALAMALLLVAAGCSGGTSNETGSAPAAGNSDNESNSANTATQEVPEIYIYQNSGILNNYPEGSVPSALEKVKQYIISEVGVNPIVTIPTVGAAEERLNLMLGSRDQRLDVFIGNWDVYAPQNAVIPLNDLLESHGQDILAKVPDALWASMTDKEGNIWGIPRLAPIMIHPIFVRQDWLDKVGLDMPQTIEQLEAALEAFREHDLNGTGVPDITMLTNFQGLKMALLGGFTEHGNSNWIDPQDNRVKPPEIAPGFEDFIIKMNEWYTKGYIHREAFTEFDPLELLKTNRVGASAIWASRITLNQPIVQSNFPEMNFQIARDFTGPAGFTQTLNPPGTEGYMIPQKAENPEAAMRFINWQYQEIENALTALFGMQDEDWKWADDGKFYVDRVKEDYVGEYALSLGATIDSKYGMVDPLRKMHYDYLSTELLNFSFVKFPIDYDIVYDTAILVERVPNVGDIERLRTEEVIKFITGARPIDDYENFIAEMNRAGLQDWIDFHTEQYFSLKE